MSCSSPEACKKTFCLWFVSCSDEESEEPSESSPSCPSSNPCYESNEAEPRSVPNGSVTPLNQETHLTQPGSSEAKVSPDSRGQPVAEDASTDSRLIDIHLDSDTDMEDEGGTTPKRPAAKDNFALELESDTDTEEPTAVTPGISSSGSRRLAIEIDSDTDIEEAEEDLSVLGFKTHRVTNDGDGDTDAEGAADNGGVESSQSRESSLRRENSCKGEERADGDPEGHQPHEEADSDTDVEAVESPEAGSKAQPPTENEEGTDVEEPSLAAENRGGTLKDREASGDSDTDVEVADSELERLGETPPHSPQPTRKKDSNADVEVKGMGLQHNGGLAEGAGEREKAGIELPKGCGAAGEPSTCLDRREPIADSTTVEQLSSGPQNQPQLAVSEDSDTDVEEAPENPKEGSEGNHQVPSCGPGGEPGGSCSGNLEVGPREDEDSETDVEVASPPPEALAAHDSDTDVEVEALPREPLEEQDTQLVPVGPSAGGEETAGSATGSRVCHDPCKEDEDTDVEGNESHPGDESNTDDEGKERKGGGLLLLLQEGLLSQGS